LWGTKINAGVWGTAAFPSVYRTDVHPFAFLPHSIRWQVISLVLTIAGAVVATTGDHLWAAALLLATGVVGVQATIAKNIAYALRSEVDSLRGPRAWNRGVVAYLHFIQPLARLRGRIRGVLSPPEVRAVYVVDDDGALTGVLTRKTLVAKVVAAGLDPRSAAIGALAHIERPIVSSS